MSVNFRLLRGLCHSNLFAGNASSCLAVSMRSKQFITTAQCTKLSANAARHNDNILFAKQWKRSFATKSNEDDADDDTDSDFSDLSDFSDSDDEDSGVSTSKQQKRVPSATPKNTNNNNSNNFKYGNDSNVSDDLLMKDRLIISNLNFSTNRNDLWELCENYGTVTDVHLPPNRNRDFQNRGFGFVTFESDQDAQNAMDNIAGSMFNSRQLRVGLARKDTEKGGGGAEKPTATSPRDLKLLQLFRGMCAHEKTIDKKLGRKKMKENFMKLLEEDGIQNRYNLNLISDSFVFDLKKNNELEYEQIRFQQMVAAFGLWMADRLQRQHGWTLERIGLDKNWFKDLISDLDTKWVHLFPCIEPN